MKFDPVKVEPAYKVVAERIEKKILQGEIATGERLPSELDIAKQLGVNRSTVREAIRSLEQGGLVRREGGRRLVASIPRTSELATRVSRAMVLHQVSFLELWEVMYSLETTAAQFAAERIGEEDLEALKKNLAETETKTDDESAIVKLDIDFHGIIARATGNKALLLAREPISLLFYPAFYNVMSRLNAGDRLLHAHKEIYSGLKNHDAEYARMWMDKHIRDFRRGYELADLDLHKPIDAYSFDPDTKGFTAD